MVLWTCFPEAYASITLTLFVPLTLAALGIVLRGASFAFRKAVFRTRDRRNFGAAFAVSSVLVPYCLGAVAGGIASGGCPPAGRPATRGQLGQPHLDPRRACWPCAPSAYLAAVYLVWDAAPALRRRDGRRTSAAGPSAPRWSRASVAFVGIFVLRADAPYLFDGLTSRALPLVILRRRLRRRALCCCSAPGAPGAPGSPPSAPWSASSSAWGVAQWPYLLPESLTVAAAAAPSGTLTAVLVATGSPWS